MKTLLLISALLVSSHAMAAGLKTEKPKDEKNLSVGEIKPSKEFKAALDAKGLNEISVFWANAGMKADNKLIDLIKKSDVAFIATKKATLDSLTGLHVTAQAAVNVGDGISTSGLLLAKTAMNLANNGSKMVLNDKSNKLNEALLTEITELLKLSESELKSEELSSGRIKAIQEKLNGRKIEEILECL